MADISVGVKLKALYGEGFYRATVTAVSTSSKRAKAPIQVKFDGYDETEWKSLKELQSKKLSQSSRILSEDDVECLEGYWRAANYLTVGQIYLRGKDPLMKKPLAHDDIKLRLLGHWGTCPGLNFVYAHLNRIICQQKLSMCYVAGPGHGGPGIVAHTYLEGEYTKVYPKITQDVPGLKELFKQFSWPRGIPSHVSPDCPGSFHEGGELGYCLLHSFGAILDNKDLIVACVIGDGEAETGPLAASWHSGKFVNPVTDGAVLPILHLNGGRIGAATIMSRMPRKQLNSLFEGYGYKPHYVEGNPRNTAAMHQTMAAAMEECFKEIKAIQTAVRKAGKLTRQAIWPMIVMRTPKGWTGPLEIDGQVVEGTFRAHQVPAANCATNAAHLKVLEDWMKSYNPDDLFTEWEVE